MSPIEQLSTRTTTTIDLVEVLIQDRRPDAVASFTELTEAQREQMAHDAWSIGLRALGRAYAQAQEARLQDVGKSLLEDVDVQLRAHIEQQQAAVKAALDRYLNADDGQLSERLRHFLADDGAIARLLERHLAPDNSMLAEALAKRVGEQSPLFRMLSPTESGGLVQVLAENLQAVLQAEHQEFKNALDPLSEDGAVARFIRRLREELKKADDDQAAQLKAALGALDANDPDSLINQMHREAQRAREALLHAINPAVENSPLAVLHRSLKETLATHAKTQQDALAEESKERRAFEQQMRDAVQRLQTTRTEQRRSSLGGVLFEDKVVDLVQQQVGSHGYIVENTANVVGIRPNCKKGDAVVHFPPDHAFTGSTIVIEAKRDRSYTVFKALEELETARVNRGACAAVFVMARSHAPAGFPTFSRHGCDVLVVWDDEDPSTNPYLEASLMLGLTLATRKRSTADKGDLQALEKVEQRLQKEIERLEKIRKAAEKIRDQVKTIEKEVGTGTKNLGRAATDAKKTLLALNVELDDEREERATPIEVEALPGELDSGVSWADEDEREAGS